LFSLFFYFRACDVGCVVTYSAIIRAFRFATRNDSLIHLNEFIRIDSSCKKSGFRFISCVAALLLINCSLSWRYCWLYKNNELVRSTM